MNRLSHHYSNDNFLMDALFCCWGKRPLVLDEMNDDVASARDGGIVGARLGTCEGWRLPTARCQALSMAGCQLITGKVGMH